MLVEPHGRRCFWHSIVEGVEDNTFLQCPTCKHVFPTEANFRKEAFDLETQEYDDNGKIVEGFSKQTWPDGTETKDIKWCPLCGGELSHD